jgi:hypothetical protein
VHLRGSRCSVLVPSPPVPSRRIRNKVTPQLLTVPGKRQRCRVVRGSRISPVGLNLGKFIKPDSHQIFINTYNFFQLINIASSCHKSSPSCAHCPKKSTQKIHPVDEFNQQVWKSYSADFCNFESIEPDGWHHRVPSSFLNI